MMHEAFRQNREEEEGMTLEDALREAGLSGIAEAPRPGTEAYKRLTAAAVSYMVEVKKVEQVAPSNSFNRNDGDDYYKPVIIKKSSSDTVRRSHHDILAKMLLGKPRKGLSKQEADQLSNFAAYVTGDEEYIDRW